MNSKQLEARIRELENLRNQSHSTFLTTSDQTRDMFSAVQNGMYWGQMALGVFRKLTNYHYSPKKRIRKALITLAIVAGINLLRKALQSRSN